MFFENQIAEKKLSIKKISIVMVVTLVLFGCEMGNQTSNREGVANSDNVRQKIDSESLGKEKPDAATSNAAGACANRYYPIDSNTVREFNINGAAQAKYVLKQALKDGGGFTETRNFASGTEVVSNWSCNQGGLRNADYNNAISASNLNVKMRTLESDGLTIPKVWEEGKKWSANYKIEVELLGRKIGGTVTIDSEIIKMDDNVSVQADDYVAARVDSVINIVLDMKKAKIPGSRIEFSNWYARDVGLVKQEVIMGKANTSVEYAGEK